MAGASHGALSTWTSQSESKTDIRAVRQFEQDYMVVPPRKH